MGIGVTLTSLSLTILILIVLSCVVRHVQSKPQQTKPGCRYEGRRYQEGESVITPEPCLQCRCVDGALRCRLRICPRLPQPSPPGCRARAPGEHVCCPELVCGPEPEDENENILHRTSASVLHHRKTEEGCLYEGVRYGPGSAMMGSRRCEYCYCISGARRCIRPKCLLPLPGCAPLYAPYSCCPVAYNCTRQADFSTTLAAISGNGCRTGQRIYQEGEMVRDIAWKAACDNCFCAMGAIRCVPLACAPPLQGCKPIVREGQCCPSTYNCSGTIEVKAAQNYASYAFISKDYAKFRKETNFYPAIHDTALGANVEGRGHRVVNEALESSTVGGSTVVVVVAGSTTTATAAPEIVPEKIAMATESMPSLETDTMNNEISAETTSDYPKPTGPRDQEQPLTATSIEYSAITETSGIDQSATTSNLMTSSSEEPEIFSTIIPIVDTTFEDASSTEPTTTTTTTTTSEIGTTTITTTTISNTAAAAAVETSSAVDEDTTATTSIVVVASSVSVSAITEPRGDSSTSITPATTTATAAAAASTASTAVTSTELSDNSTSLGKESTSSSSSSSSTPCQKVETPLGNTSSATSPVTSISASTIKVTTNATSTTTLSTSESSLVNSTTTSSPTTSSSSSSSSSSSTTSVSTTPSTTTIQTTTERDKSEKKNQTKEEEESSSSEPNRRQDEVLELDGEISRPIPVKKPSSGLLTSILMPDDMLVMNVTVKTNVAVGHLHGVTINPMAKPMRPDIAAILNITNRAKGEDYDYDYSSPTLPPSLPNVRIIPFVAADALVKDKGDDEVPPAVTGYPASAAAVPPPDLGPTDVAKFYDIVTQENRFSPPEKTEGGFVPREPPYFDPLFHGSDLNLEIGTGVTVAPQSHPVPNPHRKNDIIPNNCLYEEHEYGHGQILPSRVLCVTCICYYGEIVCSSQKCPPLKIGCHRINNPNDKCCNKIICAEDVESPTVVLDRVDANSSSPHEPTVSPDPFRDVIKTEPAPDLPSLIGDIMIPYLVEHTSPTSYDANYKPSLSAEVIPSELDLPPASLDEDRISGPSLTSRRPPVNTDDIKLTTAAPMDEDKIQEEEDDVSSIFSLDSVLDLFFNEPTVNESTTTTTTTVKSTISSTTGIEDTSEITLTTTTTVPTTTTLKLDSSSTLDIVDSMSLRNLSSLQLFEDIADTTTAPTTTTTTATTTTTTMRMTTTTTEQTSDKDTPASSGGGGLLKVAGCNIYGRMYSVGRIIAELSTSCLECKCMDVGVQCQSLTDC